jgi:hypothetical protein
VTAQGEFVNVRMTVTNIGNHAQTFYATNQHLKIGNNTYDANTMAALWTSSSNETIKCLRINYMDVIRVAGCSSSRRGTRDAAMGGRPSAGR